MISHSVLQLMLSGNSIFVTVTLNAVFFINCDIGSVSIDQLIFQQRASIKLVRWKFHEARAAICIHFGSFSHNAVLLSWTIYDSMLFADKGIPLLREHSKVQLNSIVYSLNSKVFSGTKWTKDEPITQNNPLFIQNTQAKNNSYYYLNG